MFYLNSAGNPVLYNIVSSKFRDACRRVLRCQKQQRLHKSGSLFSRQGTLLTSSTRSTISRSEVSRTSSNRSRERIVLASVSTFGDDIALEP
jgi:hypothetical protein